MSLMDLLYAQADERPDATAIVYAGERLSFAELVERIERLAHGLADRGVSAGDPVALLMRGDPWFVVCFHAVTALGAVAVPVNPAFTEVEIASCFRDAGVRWVVGDERTVDVCTRIATESEWPIEVFVSSSDGGDVPSLESLAENGKPGRLPGRDPAEPLVFQFSSGSTGRPKRMVRTHGNCAAEGRLYVSLGFGPDDTVFNAVPLFHNWGLGSSLFAQAASGAKVVILEDPNPFLLQRNRALELIESEKATIFPGVPFNFRLLAEAPVEADLSSLRLCLSAGTGLPRSTFDAFRERFGVPIRQLYGTTETGMIAANMTEDPAATFESVGRPAEGVEVEIVDEDGEPVPAGEEGEVTVVSPAMASGYAGDDLVELNEAAFPGGRYRTGDVGTLDAEGLLCLRGRTKLLIEVGGFKVDPIEVEDVLNHHPRVDEAIVVGVPSEIPGEEAVKAAVVSNSQLEEKELRVFCRERLANFKVPKVFEFRDEIPRSPLGKVLRKYLISNGSDR
jgi:long-chain acyl-CoA synthetase